MQNKKPRLADVIESYKLEEGIFEIKSTDQNIHFEICTEQSCCEDPGIRVDVKTMDYEDIDLNNIINDCIVSITKFDNKYDEQGSEDEHDSEYYEYKIIITCEMHIITVVLYNYHNGYYPQGFNVSWKDFKESGQL